MKLLVVLALVGLAVARPEDIFNEPAFNEALSNTRLLSGYLDCILGNGPCTTEGKKLIKILPDVVSSSCANCSDSDKVRAGKALVACEKHFQEKCEALKKKYDPEGKRTAELEQFKNQYGS